jgi:CheY-like chemotaxis protein
MLNEIRAAGGERPKTPPQPAAGEISPTGAPPLRVMIVEDELLVAWHLESIVQDDLRLGACVILPNAAEALERASEADVVLMDINLGGGMDGIEAARRIRENAPRPVVFVTAYGDEQTLRRVNAAMPGTPVVIKPVTREALRTAITAALKKAE